MSKKKFNKQPFDSENRTSFEEVGKQLETLKRLIFNSTESKQAHIEFIKEEVATGKYQIYSEKIAAKLMEHAQEEMEYPEMA